MAITIKDGYIGNNGQDGIRSDSEVDLAIDGTIITDNGGQGVNVGRFDINKLDEETKLLLRELKTALEHKDSTVAKKVFSALADKSMDLVVALIAGQVLKAQ